MKMYEGLDVEGLIFLTSALVGGELSASGPSCFTTTESAPGAYSVGGLVVHRMVWMTWRGEKSCPYWDLYSDLSAIQPITSCYTDCTIPPCCCCSFSGEYIFVV
jgi:hypothetical protein